MWQTKTQTAVKFPKRKLFLYRQKIFIYKLINNQKNKTPVVKYNDGCFPHRKIKPPTIA